MSKRPIFQRMSMAQQDAFEAICSGTECPPMHPRTRQWLIDHDYIKLAGYAVIGTDRFGYIKVPSYEPHMSAHIAWCQWCSEQQEYAEYIPPALSTRAEKPTH